MEYRHYYVVVLCVDVVVLVAWAVVLPCRGDGLDLFRCGSRCRTWGVPMFREVMGLSVSNDVARFRGAEGCVGGDAKGFQYANVSVYDCYKRWPFPGGSCRMLPVDKHFV